MNYEYGVEYSCYGKKPDLPDDVLVEPFYLGQWVGPLKFSAWSWGGIIAFRIVDERYKPKPEDNSWFERGELPPVGIDCEVYIEQRNYWDKVKVLAVDGDYIVWRNGSDNKSYIGTHKDNVRPIRTEREKVIEAAKDALLKTGSMAITANLETLYDAGFLRLPEEK